MAQLDADEPGDGAVLPEREQLRRRVRERGGHAARRGHRDARDLLAVVAAGQRLERARYQLRFSKQVQKTVTR